MSKNKVIWVLNMTAGKPDSGWGERHYYLSKFWVQKGYEIKIISGSYNHLFTKQPQTFKKRFTYEQVEDKITFCWVKTPFYSGGGFKKFWSNFVYAFKVFFLSSKKMNTPDIILVSSMPIFSIINGYFFKKKYKAKKLIIEVRDLWPLTPIHLKGYGKNHPLIRIVSWFEKFAYKKSDIIVSLLPNTDEYINQISKEPKKLNYIPNGIDERLLDKEEIPNFVKELFPKNKFIVGYAGTIGLANAMEFFIEASLLMKENKNIHFVLVGDGYLKNKFKEKVKTSKNITFIDKVKKSQVQSILKYFDVCYVGRYKSPLYRYGVSYNKYFDYMLAKKPILESSELIKDQVELSGCGLIVEPESAKAIVEGTLQLYQTPPLEREKMAQKGYDYVKKHHNFEYLSDLYVKLFE